jgi:hypothetical protein
MAVGSCSVADRDLALKAITESALLDFPVIPHLQVQPEPLRRPEVA